MNPLSPHLMTPMERRAALCRILALGLVRLRMREAGVRDHGSAAQSSELSERRGESSLDCLPDRSGHATPTHRRPA
jgi:hypothetical protein